MAERRPALTASARVGVTKSAVGAEESLRRGRTKERAQARKQVSKKASQQERKSARKKVSKKESQQERKCLRSWRRLENEEMVFQVEQRNWVEEKNSMP